MRKGGKKNRRKAIGQALSEREEEDEEEEDEEVALLSHARLHAPRCLAVP